MRTIEPIRKGLPALAGNHVVICTGPEGPFVLLAHLRRDTVRVRPGDQLSVGDQIGECGNSGNSTQPHVHLQVTDSASWATARGLPLAFRSFRRIRDGQVIEHGIPAESEIIEAVE